MIRKSGAPHAGALSFLRFAGVLLLIALLFISFFPGHDVVIVAVGDQIFASIPLDKGEELVYCYTHSVEQSEVREYFHIVRGRLVLTKTAMKSFGAGLPTEEADGFYFQDGWYVLALERPVPNLVLKSKPVS
jgi:hypothetical protein